MLHYHETEKDEYHLDNQPLLGELKLNELLEAEASPIFVNECVYKRASPLSNYSAYLDENENVLEESIELKNKLKSRCNMCGLFVVAFDTKYGNLIEWQIPESLNLDNVEFKAMASGFHLMENDVVYFRKDNMYGLAAFQILRSNNSNERNVRMKSVGVLAKSFKYLRQLVPFLQNQVRFQLENYGNYNDLIDLWNKKNDHSESIKNMQLITVKKVQEMPQEIPLFNKIFSNKNMKLAKRIDALSEEKIYTKFALYFGPAIFSLWRCILLNKRVLFYSAPPIADLCYRVYCASQLGNTSFNYASSKQLIRPFFYVNVMDIERLQAEPFYIACTTEKILLNRNEIFDILSENSSLSSVLVENQKSLLKVSSQDRKRYDSLMRQLNKKNIDGNEAQEALLINDESIFLEFFTDLNDKIFSELFELENDLSYYNENTPMSKDSRKCTKVRCSKLNCIGNEFYKKIGLDPADDKEFLNELVKFYDFNLRVI